jgi:hypothetical protein
MPLLGQLAITRIFRLNMWQKRLWLRGYPVRPDVAQVFNLCTPVETGATSYRDRI